VAQLDELPFYNVFRGTTHVRAIELSTRLVKLMRPRTSARCCSPMAGRTRWKVR
jgi:putrescine aminotransferase